jgi:hypothetical protein
MIRWMMVAIMLAAWPQNKTEPNFTGTWRYLEAPDAGTILLISHRATKLEVTRSHFGLTTAAVTHSVYYLDGKEHLTEETQWTERGERKQEATSKKIESVASWKDNKLVIMRDETRQEWRLSSTGDELIITIGQRQQRYKKVSDSPTEVSLTDFLGGTCITRWERNQS